MIVLERVRVAIEPMRNNYLLLLKIDVLDIASRRNSRGESFYELD